MWREMLPAGIGVGVAMAIVSAIGIQGGQLNMAVCFWYPVKHVVSSVGYCNVVSRKVRKQHGHIKLGEREKLRLLFCRM